MTLALISVIHPITLNLDFLVFYLFVFIFTVVKILGIELKASKFFMCWVGCNMSQEPASM